MPHDPGPWRIVPHYLGAAADAIESADGQLIATVHDGHANAVGNARLIALAPRMLAILQHEHDLNAEIETILDDLEEL